MILAQIILYWTAVSCYAAATVFYVLSRKFERQGFLTGAGHALVVSGLLPHTAALLLRWYQTGHGPYSQFYEVAASNAWMAVVVFLIVRWRYRKVEAVGALVMPAVFLMLGAGVMGSKEITAVPETFKTYWLLVHILFAKLTYGCALVGTALAVCYLLKEKTIFTWLRKLPDPARLDELSYRLLATGFLFNTVMIAAGSVWAKNAWGSYWSWDPIETWSLIAWLLYGAYLHLRTTCGWKGRKAGWLAVVTMAVMVFAIFGVAYLYPSIHEVYLNGKTV